MKKNAPRSVRPRLAPIAIGLALSALLSSLSWAQPTTGFNQTAAGTYGYNTPANWVGGTTGDINGIWDASLTLAGAQTVTFGENTTLLTGLGIGYTGNVDLTFRSDGAADRNLSLGGDITVAPVGNRTISFGSTTASNGLNVNLAGNRTFTVSPNKTLRFYNTISGGNIVAMGGGTVSLTGSTANASASAIEVQSNTTLYFDTTASGTTGTTRVASIDLLSGAKLSARGNNGANVHDAISGNVTIGSAGTPATSLASITVQPGTMNSLLTVGGLQRTNGGVGLIRGTNLGANSIASTTGGTTNVQVSGTAPALVGGGGPAGSTNISIVSWLIGGTSVSDNGSTFLTYTAANGFRPLNTATEFATTLVDGTSSTSNVKLSANTVLTSSTTINSLLITPTLATTISGGTLNVASGAILVNPANLNVTTIISSDLNFGSAQGVMGNGTRTAKFNKISGSGGLVLYSPGGTSGTWTTDIGADASDYTGDTYIYNKLELFTHGTTTFLPSGARTGDVYVYGQLNTAQGTQTINGLNGTGIVTYGHSNASTLVLGDNDANGDFSGVISTASTFNDLSIVKIGTGTQRLTGSNSLYNKSTIVRGGTMEVTTLANGGSASSIGGSSNVAANLVINGGTLKYTGAATSTDRLFQVGETTTATTGTINASGTGAVNFSNTDALTYGTVGTTGVAQTRHLVLTGTNTGDNTLSAAIGNNGSASNGNSAVSVTKNGTGRWMVAGANTYTGATTVTDGTLALGANNAFSANSAIVLTAGTVDLQSFSTSAESLSFNAGSTLKFDLDASGNLTALLALGGSLTKNSTGVFTLDFSGSGEVGTYNLVSYAGTTFANANEFTVVNLGSGLTGLLALGADSLSLTVSAVPEPSTYALFAGAGLLGFAVLRRRVRI
ncbi:MAG: autotransporter-associated beta strand repeat-containing protein [Opitutaceae bacterium]|jgi:fibronectin-binding autotransporter adhesin